MTLDYGERLSEAQSAAMKEVNKLRQFPGKLSSQAYLNYAEDIRDSSIEHLEYIYRYVSELNEKALMEKLSNGL